MEALIDSVEDVEWISVEDASAPGRVRRAAVALAQRLGFSEHRSGEVAIAATELGTNLFRHATAGSMLLRVRRASGAAALEIFAVDRGPGMHDIDANFREGYSSAGTLGIGLGAVRRLSNRFDAYSVVGRGTVMTATFWDTARFDGASGSLAALTRPMEGHTVCGDRWAAREDGTRTTILLADGLGHGELAAVASRAAVEAFEAANVDEGPSRMIGTIHQRLRSTRGAAAAIAQIDSARGVVRFAGAGNIAAWIDAGETRKGLPSKPGIVGERVGTLADLEYAFPENAILVMHSDGLTSKWNFEVYPGLRSRGASLIAATLLRDAGIRHDDASVVVAKAAAS
jgi:anti-sigma regulatory factor (Ser/Thr protein kinase)